LRAEKPYSVGPWGFGFSSWSGKNLIGFCLFSWRGDEKVFLTPTVYPIFQRPIDGFVKGSESNHYEERGGRRNLRKLTA
jgi:hypothetical protein